MKPTTVTFKTGLPSTGSGFLTQYRQLLRKGQHAHHRGDRGHPQHLRVRTTDHGRLTLQDPALRQRQQERGLGGRARLRQHQWGGHRLLEHPDHLTSSTTDANKFTWTVPVFITTVSLPSVKPGAKVSDTLHASGGKGPYTWDITKALPSGLKLNTAGLLSGTVAKTEKAGKYAVDVKVTDSSSPKETARRLHTDGDLTLWAMGGASGGRFLCRRTLFRFR